MKYGTMLLAVSLVVGLVGCGPPTQEEPVRTIASAARGGLLVPAREGNSLIPVATTPPSDRPSRPSLTTDPRPDASEEPASLPEFLVLPEWIARALDAPDVQVRLQALDRWAQQGPSASLDPLVVALDDEDEAVQAKAMAIIEQHWAAEQAAEP